MTPGWIRPLFLLAAAYDILLGVGFGLSFKPVMRRFDITLPNHDAYVQLPAALITVFGIGFAMVAADPRRNRDLMLLGVLMKVSYAGVVLAHWAAGNMPPMWTWFAWSDLAFAVAFLAAWRATPARG